jgi:hypothetical protein
MEITGWSTATFWYEAVPSAPLPPLPSRAERVADLSELFPKEERGSGRVSYYNNFPGTYYARFYANIWVELNGNKGYSSTFKIATYERV